MFEIRECEDYEVAKALMQEYSQIKGAEQCFVSLEQELADLGSFYQGGALLLGYEDGEPVATIAIRKEDDASCEAKRLYVRPACRGKGCGRLMMEVMLEKCRELGFQEVWFTTIPEVMDIAYGLYQRMGFEEIEEDEGTVTMRMRLA